LRVAVAAKCCSCSRCEIHRSIFSNPFLMHARTHACVWMWIQTYTRAHATRRNRTLIEYCSPSGRATGGGFCRGGATWGKKNIWLEQNDCPVKSGRATGGGFCKRRAGGGQPGGKKACGSKRRIMPSNDCLHHRCLHEGGGAL